MNQERAQHIWKDCEYGMNEISFKMGKFEAFIFMSTGMKEVIRWTVFLYDDEGCGSPIQHGFDPDVEKCKIQAREFLKTVVRVPKVQQ